MVRRAIHWLPALVVLILGTAAPASAQVLERPLDPQLLSHLVAPNPERPRAMVPLYTTLAALQGADAFLTVQGLQAGVPEQNPLMRNGRGLMTVTKVLSTAATIAIAEKMWKRNRAAAIATLVAANAVTAVVVARNTHLVSEARR